jgi:hypothetical protein
MRPPRQPAALPPCDNAFADSTATLGILKVVCFRRMPSIADLHFRNVSSRPLIRPQLAAGWDCRQLDLGTSGGARTDPPLSRYKRYISADADPFYGDSELAIAGINTSRSLTFKGGRINSEQLSAGGKSKIQPLQPRYKVPSNRDTDQNGLRRAPEHSCHGD